MGKIHDRTRFKILYDAGNLYIGIETDLNETREFKPYGRDGSCWNADCLELILDPWGTREKYFHLIFNQIPSSAMPRRLHSSGSPTVKWTSSNSTIKIPAAYRAGLSTAQNTDGSHGALIGSLQR